MGGVLVLKLELALFYIYAEQHSQLLVPKSYLHTISYKANIPEIDPITYKEPG